MRPYLVSVVTNTFLVDGSRSNDGLSVLKPESKTSYYLVLQVETTCMSIYHHQVRHFPRLGVRQTQRISSCAALSNAGSRCGICNEHHRTFGSRHRKIRSNWAEIVGPGNMKPHLFIYDWHPLIKSMIMMGYRSHLLLLHRVGKDCMCQFDKLLRRITIGRR